MAVAATIWLYFGRSGRRFLDGEFNADLNADFNAYFNANGIFQTVPTPKVQRQWEAVSTPMGGFQISTPKGDSRQPFFSLKAATSHAKAYFFNISTPMANSNANGIPRQKLALKNLFVWNQSRDSKRRENIEKTGFSPQGPYSSQTFKRLQVGC